MKTDVNIYQEWLELQDRGVTQEEHAQILEITYGSYKSKVYRGKLELDKSELFNVHKYVPSEYKFDNFIAVSDIHAPCTDYDFAMYPALIAAEHLPEGERRLIVHGDVFDGGAFSKWPKIVKEPSWADERLAASNLFGIWAHTFDEIIIMPGNHDYRRLMRLEGEETFKG